MEGIKAVKVRPQKRQREGFTNVSTPFKYSALLSILPHEFRGNSRARGPRLLHSTECLGIVHDTKLPDIVPPHLRHR